MKTLKIASLLVLLVCMASCKKSKDKDKTDTTKPEISLNGSENMTIPLGVDTPDPGATATDDTDGDISGQVTSNWSSAVNKNATGEYSVTYNVSDAKGNAASKTRNVTVKMGGSSYLGVYTSTFAVVGGGQSVVTCTVQAGTNADQFLVNAYLGNGGIPFYVNTSGAFGSVLNVVPTTGAVVLTGSGTSENNGTKINLNMQQNGSLQLVVTMVRQ